MGGVSNASVEMTSDRMRDENAAACGCGTHRNLMRLSRASMHPQRPQQALVVASWALSSYGAIMMVYGHACPSIDHGLVNTHVRRAPGKVDAGAQRSMVHALPSFSHELPAVLGSSRPRSHMPVFGLHLSPPAEPQWIAHSCVVWTA